MAKEDSDSDDNLASSGRDGGDFFFKKKQEMLKNSLDQMSFQELKQLQNKIGLKKFNQVIEKTNEQELSSSEQDDASDDGDDEDDDDQEPTSAKSSHLPNKFKRLNKNRPREMSSKKPVSKNRQVFQEAKKAAPLDPRFSSAHGIYKPEVFRKRYGFIDDMRQNEREVLTKQLKKEKDPEQRKLIKSALTRVKQQLDASKEQEKKDELAKKIRQETLADAKEGKKPLFLNKSQVKIVELSEKYNELKKKGTVEKFLAKKRKKTMAKEGKRFDSQYNM